MSIRDRIADAIAPVQRTHPTHCAVDIADLILVACPEIAALEDAREGWLVEYMPGDWEVTTHEPDDATPVLVIPKPESS